MRKPVRRLFEVEIKDKKQIIDSLKRVLQETQDLLVVDWDGIPSAERLSVLFCGVFQESEALQGFLLGCLKESEKQTSRRNLWLLSLSACWFQEHEKKTLKDAVRA